MIFTNKKIGTASWFILAAFVISMFAMVAMQPTVNTDSNRNIQIMDPWQAQPTGTNDVQETPSANTLLTMDRMDEYLTEWYTTGIVADDWKLDKNGNPTVSALMAGNINEEFLRNYMNVESSLDIFGQKLLFGSVSAPENLAYLTVAADNVQLFGNPTLDPQASVDPYYEEVINAPNQYIYRDSMYLDDGAAAAYDGTGVKIAIVDGAIDFGISDLEPALALDADGLPLSLDTEGWSLVATPMEAGTDVPISDDNKTLLFSEVDDFDALMFNDPWGLPYWVFQDYYDFWIPRDWTIDPTWVNQPGQAMPKFGVGLQYVEASYVDTTYFYALVLDIDADGDYDSAVIDMETSAFVTYVYWIQQFMGLTVDDWYGINPYLNPYISMYDWNFTNDKVVSWLPGANTGADFTFAADWDEDGVNDWSYGSMASAYNRYGFLSQNQSLYGNIINGVDPEGSGFVALYPFQGGFGTHGTLCASTAGSRGIVDYPLFTNASGSWDNPWGNETTFNLPGTANGADLVSISFGASPQDSMLAWMWAAGFELDTTETNATLVATYGAQWNWTVTSELRAHITSNSWGRADLTSGWGLTDWLIDLFALPHFGGEDNATSNRFHGYPGMLMATSAGNDGYYQGVGNAYGTLSLRVGGSRSSHIYSNVYGSAPGFPVMAELTSAGPKSIGTPNVDVLAPAFGIYSAYPLFYLGDHEYVGGNGTMSYTFWSGTSAASPSAAGVAAVAYEAYIATHGTLPNPVEMKTILKATASNLGYAGNLQGTGLLNASAACDYIVNGNGLIAMANDTFEQMVDANLRHTYYQSYFWGDQVNDVEINPTSYRFDLDEIMNQPHYDFDLSTGVIEQGQTYETDVMYMGNTSALTATGVTFSAPTVTTETFDNTNSGPVVDPFGTYRNVLNLTEVMTGVNWQADYLEIVLTGIADVYYTDVHMWVDADADGNVQIGTGDEGECHQIQRIFSAGADSGITKIGMPGRFATAGEIVLVMRGFGGTAAYWTDIAIDVTVRTYDRVAWDAVDTTVNADNVSVAIDTTGMQAGYHFGWLELAGGETKLMPIAVKVAHPHFTTNESAVNMEMIGTYQLDQWGAYGGASMADGDFQWAPINIDFTWVNNTWADGFAYQTDMVMDTVGYLVVKATIEDYGAWDDIGLVLAWDKIPKYQGGQILETVDSLTGDGVIHAYFDMTSQAGGPNWYAAGYDGYYGRAIGSGGIFGMKLGVGATYLDAPKNVTLEAYWTTQKIEHSIEWTTDGAIAGYAGDDILTGDTIIGPEANITISADVTGDPNIDWEIYFGELIERAPIHGTGAFALPLASSGRGVDAVFTADLIGGDQIYFYASVVGAVLGDPSYADDIDLAIFYPPHTTSVGSSGSGADAWYYTDFDGDEAACEGIFIAPSSGTYYFGIDSFGTTKDWFVDIVPSAASSNPTGQKTAYTFNSHEEYDDGTYGFSSMIVTGTTMDSWTSAEAKYQVTFDNELVPDLAWSTATAENNFKSFTRKDRTIDLDWTGTDANDDPIEYEIWAYAGLTYPDVAEEDSYFLGFVAAGQPTTFEWDFSSKEVYPDGWYTIEVIGTDNHPQAGESDPLTLVIRVSTTPTTITVKETVTVTETITVSGSATTTGTSSAFTLGAVFLGLAIVIPVVVRRRR